MYEKLKFELQELNSNILLTQQYLAECTDEVEKKHTAYQLVAMQDYKLALESRISIHRKQ